MTYRRLLEKLTEHWPAKVLSLAAAVLLVLFNNMTRLEERIISAPLDVRLSDAVVPAEKPPERVRVRLRGESEDIFRLEEGDLEFYLDLSERTSPGQYRVPVQLDKRYPAEAFGVVEISIEPAEITVELAARESRMVEVVPNFIGAPPSGYRLQQHTLNPPEVEIVGPEQRLDAVERIETEPIELTGRTEDFSQTVRLRAPDPLVSLPQGDRAELLAVIEETVVLTTFEPVEVVLINLDGEFELRGELPDGLVRVQAMQGAFDTIGPGEVQIIADASEVDGPGTYQLPTRPLLPSGMLVLRYEPTMIELEFEEPADEN